VPFTRLDSTRWPVPSFATLRNVLEMVYCLHMTMMMSFICSCRNKNQPKDIYPKGISHHTRLFRGPISNDMKK
jgi:hypothetical protein